MTPRIKLLAILTALTIEFEILPPIFQLYVSIQRICTALIYIRELERNN